jgi:phosphatidylglycerol:prolipoprotein diacylglycerol transferase
MSSLLAWSVLGVFLGGRVMYFIVTPGVRLSGSLLDMLLQFVAVWEGGLVFYGGFFLGIAVAIWRAQRTKLPFVIVLDTCLVAAFLGQAIGRWGCLLAGCDYGIPVQVADPANPPWWVLQVPDPLPEKSNFPQPAPGVPLFLHPTQIYMSIHAFILYGIGRVILERQRAWGVTTCWIAILYAIGRSIIEVYRGDADRGIFLGISTSQWFSIPVALAGVIGLILLHGRRAPRAVFGELEERARSAPAAPAGKA